MHSLPLLSLLALCYLVAGTQAAECTDAEDQSITDAYSAAAATSACSSYASVGILIIINPPCSATDCVAVMENVASTIPNCTSGTSTSENDQLLKSLSICATPTPTPASTASSTNCTRSEAKYNIQRLAYETTNKKTNIGTQSSICEELNNDTNVSINIEADHNLLGSSDGTTSLSSAVSNCTAEEVEEKTLAYYLAVATNGSCQNNASICAYDIAVITTCSIACGELVRELWSDLPMCYYNGLDHIMNVLNNWSQC
ncbi:unnamed protein product [Phytophthora lilii]|uniref:Unnamed protein product n=1 Tax=Phytophthora lilii TaxID=2077276 RepID=A0A9W6WK92_9STRA|nr:unnamed protein product [Phytophthora lilii]